jgi:cytoskeleton protein RodZ
VENSEISANPSADPGSLLRQAREALNISQREMADRLNWMPDYVGALEENRFEVLRGAAFVRGYLRAYAKQVNVDEAELLVAYESVPAVVEYIDDDQRQIESGIPQMQKKGWALPAGIGIALGLLLLLWLVQGGDEVEVEAEAEIATSAEPVTAVTQVAIKSTEATPQNNDIVASDLTPAVTELSAAPVVEIETGEIETVASTTVERSPVEPVTDSAAVRTGVALDFSFSGECWLEVRNGRDELIYADLRQAGDVFSLDGEPPFSVLVGDSRFVSLSYQGESVAIRPPPGRVIARFVVGET